MLKMYWNAAAPICMDPEKSFRRAACVHFRSREAFCGRWWCQYVCISLHFVVSRIEDKQMKEGKHTYHAKGYFGNLFIFFINLLSPPPSFSMSVSVSVYASVNSGNRRRSQKKDEGRSQEKKKKKKGVERRRSRRNRKRGRRKKE